MGATVGNEARRVLVVDDEPGVLRMYKMALTTRGFAVEEARDGREAMERLTAGSFDVIVTDVNMPGYGGLEFLRAVREKDLDVPVIMMTGKPSVESSNKALEYGAFRYLIKPVPPATLAEAIDRAARLHEIARVKRHALELLGDDRHLLGTERAALEVRFGKAIDAMWVAFQPIISWKNRTVYGYEALLRSEEPTLANPGAFLEAAERLGKLHTLGRAIRARAANASPPPGAKLFVNLHAADLNDDELFSKAAPLSKIAERVVLEVTERASLDCVKDLDSRIRALRQLGFSIAIDDLGAGYAGLSSFTLLEPNVSKFDMSLIRGIEADPRKQSIVKSLRSLCADLGMAVVAEGVETPAERDTLVEIGCDLLQGYLFAKPGKPFPSTRWE